MAKTTTPRADLEALRGMAIDGQQVSRITRPCQATGREHWVWAIAPTSGTHPNGGRY
jgi:hypothetical protein